VDRIAARALGDEVHLIDTQMGGYDGITAAYLIRSDRPALVETGAARSADLVVAALADLGVAPDDLATIVVTHIHLDHAGGVGDLAAAFPRAEVVVHERGARHLVAPERLLSSARRVYGDVLDTVFGELLPTPAERIRALGDVGEVDLGGGRRLSTHWSPGHASHHVGLLDSATGDLYVGDAAGIYVPEADLVRPATPPPDFDLPVALSSIEGFRSIGPDRLLFSHFGPVTAVEDTLDRSIEELELWVELARSTRREGLDLDHAVAAVQERTRERYAAVTDDPELRAKHDALNSDAANLSGILRWLDQVEPA
jgi:glyoxylase-like metal-dependent hydrolase (beta-lactamase superfamily II)